MRFMAIGTTNYDRAQVDYSISIKRLSALNQADENTMRENVIDRVFTRANDPADSNFSRLRGQQIVDKLLRCYPDYAPNIKRAHDRLENRPWLWPGHASSSGVPV